MIDCYWTLSKQKKKVPQSIYPVGKMWPEVTLWEDVLNTSSKRGDNWYMQNREIPPCKRPLTTTPNFYVRWLWNSQTKTTPSRSVLWASCVVPHNQPTHILKGVVPNNSNDTIPYWKSSFYLTFCCIWIICIQIYKISLGVLSTSSNITWKENNLPTSSGPSKKIIGTRAKQCTGALTYTTTHRNKNVNAR